MHPSAPRGPVFSPRRHASKWLPVAAIGVCGVIAGCGGGSGDDEPPAQVGKPLDLTILHINDHHSNLDADSRTLQLLNAAGQRVAVDVDAAGFPRVTTAMRELAAGKDHVLKLHAGDALTGTLYFNRAGQIGEADAAMMNTVCFDAFTLGNHEFDKGDAELKRFIDRLHAGACKTPAISANVQFGANSALHPSRAADYVKPYVVVERGGEKIGLVGLTIATKTKQSSSPDADTTFEDEVTAAQRAIDGLRTDGVNKIIVQSHIGYGLDREIIAQLSGVDVVIGGDSHSLLGPNAMTTYGVGSPAGAYAETLRNKDGEPVCIGQAWEYSQVVGEMRVSFDADGVVTACGGTPHVLIGGDFTIKDAPVSDADRTAMLKSVQDSGFLRITAPDAGAAALLAPFKEAMDQFRAQVVATAPQELCSRRVPGGQGSVDYSRSSVACNAQGLVSVHGGDIQQLVAHAYLEVANAQYGGADITLQSGGGVRVPLQGSVTAANVIEVLPFGNLLWKLEVTGAEVRAMIEDGLDATFRPGGSTGPYPYAGGLRFDVNASLAKGARASNFQVRDASSGSWQPLDDARTYRLFVLSFNAEGGDGYTTLANIPAERRSDVGVLDADVFQTYIDGLPKDPSSGLPVLRKLPVDLYSTHSFIR